MLNPAPQWTEACGHAAVVLLSVAAALYVPCELVMGGGPSWLFVGYFVGAVWASALLIASPARLVLTLLVSTIVWTSAIRVITEANGPDSLKLTAEAMYPLGPEGGPVYEMLAYLISAMLLLVPMLMRIELPKLEPLRLARALLISLSGLLVVLVVLSFVGLARFFDPLKMVFFSYLFPLMASAIAVFGWYKLKDMARTKGDARG